MSYSPDPVEFLEDRICPAILNPVGASLPSISPPADVTSLPGALTSTPGVDSLGSLGTDSALGTGSGAGVLVPVGGADDTSPSDSTTPFSSTPAATFGTAAVAAASFIVPSTPAGGVGGIFSVISQATSGSSTALGVTALVSNTGATPLFSNTLNAGGSTNNAGGNTLLTSTGVGLGGFGYGFNSTGGAAGGAGGARGVASAGSAPGFIGSGSGASSSFSGATGTGLSASFSGATGAGSGNRVGTDTTSPSMIGGAPAEPTFGPVNTGVTGYTSPGSPSSSGVTGYNRPGAGDTEPPSDFAKSLQQLNIKPGGTTGGVQIKR